MNYEKYLKKYKNRLQDKNVVVFGATGGIGRHLCRYILMLGGSLITVDRNQQKAEKLTCELKKEFSKAKIKNLVADLHDFNSVKAVCNQLEAENIYALIHNAGAYNIPRKMCETGFNNVFQINFVSPYYITKRLLPTLCKTNGRVVAVGSIAHNYSKTDPEDIDFSSRKASSLVYGNAKRFLMFSLYGLFEKQNDCTLCVTHPGITFTNITNHYPKWIFWLIKNPMKIIFMPAKKAALSIIEGLFNQTEKFWWIGPRFFNVWGLPAKRLLSTCSCNEYKRICETAQEILKKLS